MNLEKTAITDAGLLHLAKLPGLKIAVFRHTAVTAAGVSDLKSKLPGLEVGFD